MQEQVATRKQTKPSQPTYKMKIEKDVDIPMRDGTILKADVFRPDATGIFPCSSTWASTRRTSSGCRRTTSRRSPTLHELGDRQSGMVGAARLYLPAGRRARLRQVAGASLPIRSRRRSTSTTRSSGPATSPGARPASAPSASRSSPARSGGWPTSSRRRSSASCRGRAPPISTATCSITAAFSAPASS